ncbi:MAG: TauD/TfdA family dioxygenase [Rhodospirillales bacterium]|jgi:hypothetical protein|nr:hypothetical protein [Rhodospirillaceae bacterium]MDP6430477.1 TauD/TfdA family dioxygenase [Rhodospirillales bacterium]MDP6646526.1 TauD/TfdA family dioxygenase [Rhodospirillales bacterium]
MDAMNQGREAGREPAVAGKPVIDPADWTADQLMGCDDWLLAAEAREISHLVEMARGIAGRIGDDAGRLLAMSRADFDIGPFAGRLEAIMAQVKDGLGLALYRGLPMDDLSLIEAAIIYWGIGRHIGEATSNNPEGDMIGHVTDTGKDYRDPKHRGYQTNVTMDYHCDQTDIVTLLCINTAKSGGQSKIASSIAVYNELLKRDGAAAEILTQPYCWTKHSEKDTGEANYYQSPVFNFLGGVLCTSFGPKHMEKGHDLAEAPDMTAAQLKALRLMEQVAEDLHAEMDLARGDIQFVNNYTILHTRTGFEDWPEPERKRVLWRLWLMADGFRPSTPYSEQWLKGVSLTATKERITLVYEG